jgi:general stress protein YciG
MSNVPKQRRGFALLDAEARRKVSKKGGKSATGRHKWDSTTAAEAGRRSGRARRRQKGGAV